MNSNTIGKTTLKVFVLAVSLLTVSAADKKHDSDHHQDQAHGKHPMVEKLRPLIGQEFEKQFLKEMIQHHKDGVQMASMAVQKAKNNEVKALAQKNIDKQTKESDQMRQWLQSWHSDQPKTPSPDEPAMKKMMQEMESLRAASGSQFDEKFLTSFSDHHQGAIEMSKLAKEKKVRQELAKKADEMIQDQSSDIEKMKKLKSEVATASR